MYFKGYHDPHFPKLLGFLTTRGPEGPEGFKRSPDLLNDREYRSRSVKSNKLFSVSKQCIYASLVQKKTTGLEDRAQKRLNLVF